MNRVLSWETHAHPRCKDLIWRAIHDALPVKLSLKRRRITEDTICPVCGDHEESTAHALLYCPDARKIWFLSPLGLRIDEAENYSFKEWIKEVLQNTPEEFLPWLCFIAWAIWKRRNLWVFEMKRTEPDKVVFNASLMQMIEDPEKKANKQRSTATSVWKAPPSGWMKVNTDASIRDPGGTGFGMIIRNNNGILIAAATKWSSPVNTPQISEALCLRWGIMLAREQGINDLVMETDCLQLKQAWNRTRPHNNHLDMIVQDCKALSSSFRNFDVIHCCRTANVVADFLAHMAFDFKDNLWRFTSPPGTTQLIQLDAAQCNVPEVSSSV